MHKQLFKKHYLLYTLLITLLLGACSTTPDKSPLNTKPGPTTTICPQSGTARAAVSPSIKMGTHAELIYYSGDNSNSGYLRRIDVKTNVSRDIANLPNADILEAQVSPDGQWILFVLRIDSPHEHVELRIVRVDGQYQQSLFCMPASSTPYSSEFGQFLWSPDLTSVAIEGSSGPYSLPAINIVDLAQGSVQLVLASTYSQVLRESSHTIPGKTELYSPLKWLDNTHLYVGAYKGHINSNEPYQYSLYLLDTSKGANQNDSDMQQVFTTTHPNSGSSICDFDSSSDGTQLFVAQCTYKNGNVLPQGSIIAESSTGSQQHTIFASRSLAIIGVRVISPQTLLILTDTSIANGYSGDNLWKINTDGSGLTHLASGNALTWCSYLQNNCTNISPDGSMYAYTAYGGSSDQVFYGSLAGGTPHQVLQLTWLYEAIVGWTMTES